MERHRAALMRWAHRRLPIWVRSVADTADVVQDAIARTLPRLPNLDIKARGALEAYLRAAISHRISDEFRVLARRGMADELDETLASAEPTPHQLAEMNDLEARYKAALERLRRREQLLIVGHVELGYSIDQLACLCSRTPATTRVALRRALVRLAGLMNERSTRLYNA